MSGGTSILNLPVLEEDDIIIPRRRKALKRRANFVEIEAPVQPESDIEPINQEQKPKDSFSLKAFFGVQEPEVQSYEEYKKRTSLPPAVDKVGGVLSEAADTVSGAGKAAGKFLEDAAYKILTPRYEQRRQK